MRRNARSLVQLSVVLLLLLILSVGVARAADPPRIRVVHAAPVVPALDVYVDGILYFENIFYTIITDYSPIDVGDQDTARVTVDILAAMSSSKDDGALIKDESEDYSADQDYTLIIAGSVSNRPDHPPRWRLVDDNKNLPGTGTSRVRIVHASADTPSTEFCLADVCHTLAFKGNSGYFLMDPGTYIPAVHLNGTDPSHIKTPPLVLQDNSIHTVFLVGKRHGKPGLELLYSFDAGEPDLNPHPSPPDYPGEHPEGSRPPPEYPPVSGALLSPRLLGMIAGALLILVGGIGFWFKRD